MGRLSRWAVDKPKTAIAAWVLMAAVIATLAGVFGGTYSNSFTLPDTESSTAQTLLESIPGASDAFSASTAKIVWSPTSGDALDAESIAVVSKTLNTIAELPSVKCIVTPFGEPLGNACATSPGVGAGTGPPEGISEAGLKTLAGLAPAGVSLDKTVAYATVQFEGAPTDLPAEDGKAVLAAVKSANSDTLLVGANGSALEYAGQEPPSSELIGITVALILLLFAFGSIVGAFLPIISAVLSLAVGQAVVLLTANVFDVATFAPTLAAMIGLGVGIDYSLFVINRYKQSLDAGREPRAAAHEAVRTSGRAVVFAASTVIIALLGLFVLRINFFNGLAVAASATVVMMMIGAIVLLPAVLSLLGRRAFAWKMPWARKPKPHNPHGNLFSRYGAWLETHYKWFGALAAVLIVVIALPLAGLRLGFTDDSGKAAGTPARVAYDLTTEAFGPGLNGPLTIAVKSDTPENNAALGGLTAAISADPGVALALPVPFGQGSTVTAIQVIPTTGPQEQATTELPDRLRAEVIPAATAGGGVAAYVGGTQAITSDFTTVLTDSLPLLLLVVMGLGFVALVLLFRSLVVPLTGVITSLLSLAAAMGVTVAVFQWGWAASLLGVSGTGPIMPFLPIMVFAILFGLSMDYQVFLVSRMQEEWAHTGDNKKAVRRGLGASGRVVALAAAIMISVFAAFILGSDATIKLFGLALATAVLFDAFLVRLIIVPSLMYALGNANWFLPSFLERILPKLSVETEEDLEFENAEIEDIPEVRA